MLCLVQRSNVGYLLFVDARLHVLMFTFNYSGNPATPDQIISRVLGVAAVHVVRVLDLTRQY